MTKAQLTTALNNERKRSENLQRLNNKLFVAMNAIASGYGHTRNGVTKSEYLAVDILTEIARESNK